MRWTPLFVVVSFTAACTAEVRTVEAEDAPNASSLPSDPATFGTDDPVRPGHYERHLDGVPVNACGQLAEGVAPQTAMLDWIDTDRFTWTEGTECMVFGSEYACDLTVSRQAVSPSAELIVSTRALGLIVDPETLEEEQEVRVSCEGPGCDAYEAAIGASFPCEMVVETTPVWRGL